MTCARTLANRTPTTRWIRRTSAAVALLLAALPAASQNQLWIQQPGTSQQDSAKGMAADGSGGVFATGSTNGSLGGPTLGSADAWLARYDSGGDAVWLRQLGSTGADESWAVASDGGGGVFVAGATNGNVGGPNAGIIDGWLARYDSAGNKLWVRQLGTTGYDLLRGAAPDGSGGVYVCGTTTRNLGGANAGLEDVVLARYDGAGNQLWIRQIGTSKDDGANSVANGPSGVFVCGITDGNLGGSKVGSRDAWVALYDSAGNQLWIRQVGTTAWDTASACTPDEAGGVYLTGQTQGSLGGTIYGPTDAWLARFDSAGTRLWARQLGTISDDYALGVAPDGSGGAYFTGLTTGSLGGPLMGEFDAWVARYDSKGNHLWVQQIGTAGDEVPGSAASDGAGGVYIGGSTNGSLGGPNAGSSDPWLARYDGECGTSSIYCTASSTSIPGCQAQIGFSGSPSVSKPLSFRISSSNIPGGNTGLCFFGDNGPASTPFGTLGGQVCVQGPLFRTAPKSGGGFTGECDGSFAFTLQDLIDASPIIVPGAVIHAEIWARDYASPDGFLLSNGLELTVCG
jgi:hypothetical protein